MTDTPGAGRPWLVGLISAPVLFLALTSVTVFYWPPWPGLRTGAALLDNLVPHMAVAAVLGAALMAVLGAPRPAVILCLVAAFGALGNTAFQHWRISVPLAPERQAGATVLWLNMLNTNSTDPTRLVAALEQSPADLILVAEPAVLKGQLARLAETFPLQSCDEDSNCSLLVLSRTPGTRIQMRSLGRLQEPRLALVDLPMAGGESLRVLGVHLVKPWFFGFSESEDWYSLFALDGMHGPLLMTGDLNAAPWSQRVRRLADLCDMAPARLPPPTWPTRAGWLGVPIDHMLVRGARLSRLERWGQNLGSNHAGLLAEVVPGPAASPDCRLDFLEEPPD